MKIEDIKKVHLKLLKNECEKLYKLKFPWADDVLLEKLTMKRYFKVIEAMNEEQYKQDLVELLD